MVFGADFPDRTSLQVPDQPADAEAVDPVLGAAAAGGIRAERQVLGADAQLAGVPGHVPVGLVLTFFQQPDEAVEDVRVRIRRFLLQPAFQLPLGNVQDQPGNGHRHGLLIMESTRRQDPPAQVLEGQPDVGGPLRAHPDDRMQEHVSLPPRVRGVLADPQARNDRIGDARAGRIIAQGEGADSSYVYISKPSTAYILLYRNATVWLHLAEAINRMGYPDAAFAVLKNGLHSDLPSYR